MLSNNRLPKMHGAAIDKLEQVSVQMSLPRKHGTPYPNAEFGRNGGSLSANA
jgi:hypothetical protein